MLHSSISWCLRQVGRAEAAGADDPFAALSTAIARVDPLMRSAVRARVDRLLHDAQLTCTHEGHRELTARCASLAYDSHPADPRDPEALTRAFDETAGPPSAAGPNWPVTRGLLAIAGVSLALLAFYAWAPDYVLDDELERPSQRAFLDGGRPLPGERGERELFASTLPQWVVALDQLRPASDAKMSAGARAEVITERRRAVIDGAEEVLGPQRAQTLASLLETATALVLQNAGTADDVYTAAAELNAALSVAGLGYQLDVAVITSSAEPGSRVLIASFQVEWVQHYRSGALDVRALRWRRIDALSFDRAVLGYTRPEMTDAVVLMDRIDTWLVLKLLPALVPAAPLHLADEETRLDGPTWITDLEVLAGQHARRQLAAVVGDEAVITDLGRAVIERREVIDGFSEQLSSRGVRLRQPESYALDVDQYEAIEAVLMPGQWADFESLQDRLEGGELGGAHRKIRRALADSVERHEVQHRLDFQREGPLPHPAALEDLVGPLQIDGETNRLAQRSLWELSAYLSELARSHQTVKVNLASLSRHIFDRGRWGTAECYAALVIVGSLAERESAAPAELIARQRIDRRRAFKVVEELLTRDDEALAASASLLYADLFGEPLGELVQRQPAP